MKLIQPRRPDTALSNELGILNGSPQAYAAEKQPSKLDEVVSAAKALERALMACNANLDVNVSRSRLAQLGGTDNWTYEVTVELTTRLC